MIGIYKSQTDQTSGPLMLIDATQAAASGYVNIPMLGFTRYSMRRLGLNQNQVKQMLHVIRRGFIHRVIHDLKRTHKSVLDQNSDDV